MVPVTPKIIKSAGKAKGAKVKSKLKAARTARKPSSDDGGFVRQKAPEPPPEEGVRGIIKADPVFVRTTNKIGNLLGTLDIEATVEELMTKQATRKIRTLSVQDILANQQVQMIEANLQNQAYRSRAVEIKMKVLRIAYTVEDALSSLRKYILARYLDQIKGEVSTVADRHTFVDSLLSEYTSHESELNMLTDLCNEVVSDIDAAGYSLLRIQQAVALTAPENHH